MIGKAVAPSFLREPDIENALASASGTDASRVRDILAKARTLAGLDAGEVAALMAVSDAELLEEMFAAAKEVKLKIYGKRLVLFAPLYITNKCGNECSYCAFRARNRELERRTLTQEEIAREAKTLVDLGHKRLLLVAGESYGDEGFDYVIRSIETIYKVHSGRGDIRRVNVNVAPLTVDEFKALNAADIGAYQLFQETYHRPTYASVHLAGPKKDFDWRVTVMDRAMEAGIGDVGMGVLFGLYDWKWELLAMMQHIRHLEETYGAGCHTISVPRIEPAAGSDLASRPPHLVDDDEFIKLIAILRLAVPYTGIVMSTRENAGIRRRSFEVGVSSVSAGSRTNPGGYADEDTGSQFQLGDHRPLDVVVREIAEMGYVPSFCTACYRLGRQGEDFMEFAKPGDIQYFCGPNALSTLVEYIEDYASPETRKSGENLVRDLLANMDDRELSNSLPLLKQVRAGKRDIYI